MNALTEQFRQAAVEARMDLCGIAPIERFDGLDARKDPRTIFPECKNVIVLGKRIVRGCLRGMEEGTSPQIYRTFAMNWLPDRFMALATVGLASWLEDRCFEAVPMPCLPPEAGDMGIPVREGAPAPNVILNFDDLAVRAGLGEIGMTGMFMTPQFGHLQRLQVILTDAPLEATPIFEGQVCDRCGQCAVVCPLDAIDPENLSEIEIAGKTMTVAAVDERLCGRCENGACANIHHPAGKPDRFAAVCMRTCTQHMYEAGLLEKTFRNSFRNRPAWVIDNSGVPKLQGEEA